LGKLIIMAEPKENQGEGAAHSGAGGAATDVLPLTQKYLRDAAELIKNLKALGGITELESKIDRVSLDLKELAKELNGLGQRLDRETGELKGFVGTAKTVGAALLLIFGPVATAIFIAIIVHFYRVIDRLLTLGSTH
jgi:hypothetical protein